MPQTNFTWEAGRLLRYIGRTLDSDKTRLSEIRHDLESLGLALQRSDLQNIGDVCSDLLTHFKEPGEGRATLIELRDKARAWREVEIER